jgi:hypothetical protein
MEGNEKTKPKRRKDNKSLRHNKKVKRGEKKKKKNSDKKTIKEKEPNIKVLPHELVASTLSYLILAPC